MIALATGIVVRDGRLLMVASRYPNHAQPLWNLPGGRQLPGELLSETVVREVFEETGLRVEPGEVAYVSESYDGERHFLNVTFRVAVLDGESSFESLRTTRERAEATRDHGGSTEHDHVVEVAWVALDEVAQRIVVDVVREPLLTYLQGDLAERYAGYHDAGITIEWPQNSR